MKNSASKSFPRALFMAPGKALHLDRATVDFGAILLKN